MKGGEIRSLNQKETTISKDSRWFMSLISIRSFSIKFPQYKDRKGYYQI